MHSKTSLQYIVVIEKIDQNAQIKAESLNIKLLTFENFKQIGENLPKPAIVSDNEYKVKAKTKEELKFILKKSYQNLMIS